MADKKITALTAKTILLPSDYIVLVDDPAGTPVTKRALVSAVRGCVYKTAQQLVNNSAVLVNDNELLFPVVANTSYDFEFVLLCAGTSTTPDIKLSITVPSGQAYWSGYFGVDVASSPVSRALAGGTQSFGSKNGSWMIILKGTAVITSPAGNVVLQFAQDTAHASDTKITAHSHVFFAAIA